VTVLDDHDVIAGCRTGDREAFRALFDAYQDRVYSIALRYTGDPAQALDIAQDVFLKLLNHIGEYRGLSGFETWLYRVVVNRCLDDRRRLRRWTRMFEGIFESASEPSALDQLLRHEMEARVQNAIAMLAPEQRIIVVLRYTEGLGYAEIARIVGCSEGTVASRLNRAHQLLKKRLKVR
jgi:RNA polymerase sigma-70 factor, ECF subfamily